jgi:hypothetical protein
MSVKTLNTVAIANVKTYNGVAIANVKTINGVDVSLGASNDFLTSLEHSWEMNEASGNMIDAVGNNNGTVSGVTYGVTGVQGDAYSFDNTTDKVTVGTTATHKWMHGADDTSGFNWTIELWMKFAANAGSYENVGNIWSSDSLSSSNVGVGLFYDDRGIYGQSRRIRCQINRGVGGGANVVISGSSSNNALNDDTSWQQVVLTYDQSLSSANMKFYVNGSSQGSGTKTGKTPSTANSTIAPIIGDEGGFNLNGISVDLFRIWKTRVFTGSEISDLYNSGSGLAYGSFA